MKIELQTLGAVKPYLKNPRIKDADGRRRCRKHWSIRIPTTHRRRHRGCHCVRPHAISPAKQRKLRPKGRACVEILLAAYLTRRPRSLEN